MYKLQAQPEHTLDLAKILNDDLAQSVAKYPTRFAAFGTLPMQAPELAAQELKRCVKELGRPSLCFIPCSSGIPICFMQPFNIPQLGWNQLTHLLNFNHGCYVKPPIERNAALLNGFICHHTCFSVSANWFVNVHLILTYLFSSCRLSWRANRITC